jgi:hypothetical protein
MSEADKTRVIRLEVQTDSDDDRAALRGALLSARATELGEIRRRSGRLSLGYGTESARDTMTDEVDQHQRRWTMLDRLLAALDEDPASRDA